MFRCYIENCIWFSFTLLKVPVICTDASNIPIPEPIFYWMQDKHIETNSEKKIIFKFSLSLYWIYPAWNWLLAENKFCIYAGNGNEILTLYLKIKWFRNWFINLHERCDEWIKLCNEYKMFSGWLCRLGFLWKKNLCTMYFFHWN